MILIDAEERWCRACDTIQPLTSFYKDKKGRLGYGYYCKSCANKKSRITHNKRANDLAYKTAKKNAYIKNRFGITLQEYLEKLAQQNYRCAICQVGLPTSGYFTHLDHNHKTGKLRRFLCTNCNRGLGHFQDSSEFLRKAADYLDAHNISVDDVKEERINDHSR